MYPGNQLYTSMGGNLPKACNNNDSQPEQWRSAAHIFCFLLLDLLVHIWSIKFSLGPTKICGPLLENLSSSYICSSSVYLTCFLICLYGQLQAAWWPSITQSPSFLCLGSMTIPIPHLHPWKLLAGVLVRRPQQSKAANWTTSANGAEGLKRRDCKGEQ